MDALFSWDWLFDGDSPKVNPMNPVNPKPGLVCALRNPRDQHIPLPNPPRRLSRCAVAWLAFVLLIQCSAMADSVVVFNEIMYHPASDEPAMEWVELHNQNAVDVDLGGWRLAGGIDYLFPNGTIIKGRGYLVIAISPDALRAAAEMTTVVGPFAGRLSNNGDQLKLRDLNNRLMDTVGYGVDGDWPASPDGAGTSLAKRSPNLASEPPESWTASTQIGGTPGAANFSSAPIFGPRTSLVSAAAHWRFEDSGTDLGAAWRAPGFDDSAWGSGTGLFFVEEGTLPGPKNTPLTADRNTYYFRGTFQLEGNPADQVVKIRPIVDDGAVVYVNSTEVARFNMPTGAVKYATTALATVANANYSVPLIIPSSALIPGQNVIAVEVHQTMVATNAGLKVTPASGYTAAWDGGDGDFYSAGSPALAPPNDALASRGVEVFPSSNKNLAAALNDGRYGNGSAWAPAAGDAISSVILRFNQVIPISSVAWGRDNGDTTEAGCGGAACTAGTLGSYTFQYTLGTNPAVVTATSSNPSNGWTTVITAQFLSTQPGFTPHLRHRFDFAGTNGLLLATGIRLRATSGQTIDEIEINPPAVAAFDAVFGLEVTRQEILPAPPKLVFNELSAASAANSWLEIINTDDTSAELGGVQVVPATDGSPSYTFPAQTIAPGGIVSVAQAQLGFGTADQAGLFLYTPGRSFVLDAVTVRTNGRARFPDGSGAWMFPSAPTPGASNVFVFHDELVFNEIMYHAAPLDPVPAVTTHLTALGIAGSWRYQDAGADLGAEWRAPGYDDSSWPSGPGLMAFNATGLPAPTGTTLAGDRTTYYFRTSFNFTGGTTNLTLDVRSVVDDGAVFYLNGSEIYRQNMPAGPVTYATPASGPVGSPGYTGPITLPGSSLVQGANVLAVEVHQAASVGASSGLTLTGGGLKLVEEGPNGGTPPMNLAREAGAAPFVIDSLAGYPIHNFIGLTDGVYGNNNSWIGNSGNPAYAGVRFGGLFTISSVAFGRDNTGTYSDRTAGLYTLQFTRVPSPGIATTFTGNPDTGWATVGTLNYQSAGSGLFANPSRRHRFTFTPVDATGLRLLVPSGTCIDELEVNPPESAGDIAFGAELVLTTTLAPARPFTPSTEEWVELHNRSTHAVNLTGWRLDGAIDYRFPAGTVVPIGGHLVVAKDAAALRAMWPEVAANILGNFTGKMGGGKKLSLKDAANNPVNTVHIAEGGWSDGGGSSLELTDPRADNARSTVWADSDETGRSDWQSVTYRMIAGQRFGNVLWNEFRIGMLDAGEVLVDEVSVVRNPNGARQQLIQNGDFESTAGNTHWRMLGNHARSQIVGDPANPANHVLKVTATGPARTSHNHIESSFVSNTPLVNGQEYEVSFRARWLAGSPQLGTTAYFQKLARTTLLPVPTRHGTPGSANSRRVPNTGPTFTDLKHSPIIPQVNEAVTVSVRASDPDGVASATLSYRVNPAITFTNVVMVLQADGVWTGTVPGLTAGRIVQFYVTAQDGLDASGFAPGKGPDSRALYQVADTQGAKVPAHELRLIQLNADRDFLLNATNVMSQQRLGATVIYDRSEVFYDVGVRLHGSAAGRARDGDDYISYDIEFPPDRLFRGVQGSVGIDRSGRAPNARQQDEIYVLHMFQRAGLPCHHSDLCYFIAPKTIHTGPAILQLGAYNGLFVDEQFNRAGSVFNFDVTYEPSVTASGNFEGLKLPVPLQGHIPTDLTDLGDDKEQYRAPFNIRHGERADDFTGIVRLCKTMGLPQTEFDARIAAALDVSEALRLTALHILCGLADIYFSATPSLPHNCRIFTPADGGPAQFLPWDMDFVFLQDDASSIFPTTSANISKLVNHPANRRLYLWHVNDLCQTVFNTSYMNPWLAHYGSVVGQSYAAATGHLQARRSSALSQLPAVVPFAITSNNGNGFAVDTNSALLTGTGWLDIKDIEVNGISYPVDWTSVTNWAVRIPLSTGNNLLTVQGVDGVGNRPANRADSISVTNTLSGTLRPVVINEWMAENLGAGGFADPADGLFQDWFELFNPNDSAVDLGGYYLTDDLSQPMKWAIPSQRVIAPRGFLLVWADENGPQNLPGNADLHASFKLSGSGEALGLFAPDGISPRHTVTFGPQSPNVSEGLFPDGAVGSRHFMANWTPRASNRLGAPTSPQITAVTLASKVMTLSFSAIPGRTYRLEYTDDLGAPSWAPLGEVRTARNETVTLMENIGASPRRFFRVRLE